MAVTGLAGEQVAPACMIWGAGTALGEVPPYAVALHAARAGEKNSDIEKMLSVRRTSLELCACLRPSLLIFYSVHAGWGSDLI